MNNLKKNKIFTLFLVIFFISTYLTPVALAAAPPIEIDAAAALLADPNTGMILYSKNMNDKRYPASTTKIMTALLTLEHAKLDDVVTVTEEDFKDMGTIGSSGGLKAGENVKVLDLLYCLMLPSANEAANALARHVGGSIDGFVKMMNDRSAELGCKNTHFANPNGLHREDHYTTAYDLFLIAREAMKNETFRTVVNTAQKMLSPTNINPNGRKIYTTNQLILRSSDPSYYRYCDGIKTGFTTPAGYCFVSAATKSNYTFISVVMGCTKEDGKTAKSFTETKRLFEWGFKNFGSVKLIKKNEPVSEAKVRLGKNKDTVMLVTENELSAIMPKDVKPEELTKVQDINKDIAAPITKGQILGTLSVSYQGQEYGKVNLIAMTDIELSQVLYYQDKLDNFFQSRTFKFILLGIVCFIILYVIYMIWFNRHRRRKYKKQMRSKASRYRRYK